MEFKDYYKTLGVERTASQDEIKRAYRRLARRYHPDVSSEADAETRFKEVSEAYEVLKDPEKRAAYDQLGRDWQAGQDFRPPPDWDAGFEFSGGGFTDADARHFSDFFESLFGAGGPFGRHGRYQRSYGAMRGEDHHARILISLEDAYHGASRRIQLQTPVVNANGQVTVKPRSLDIRIPKGITAGQQIRLAGQGAAGLGGGAAGDLYLEIEFEPHPLYQVEGRDLYLTLPVTPWEAALGSKVEVPTLAGRVALSLPAGSQSARKLRLKGKGLPGKPPGDQYVVLRIVNPPADSPKARELYQRMAEELPFNPRKQLEDYQGAA